VRAAADDKDSIIEAFKPGTGPDDNNPVAEGDAPMAAVDQGAGIGNGTGGLY